MWCWKLCALSSLLVLEWKALDRNLCNLEHGQQRVPKQQQVPCTPLPTNWAHRQAQLFECPLNFRDGAQTQVKMDRALLLWQEWGPPHLCLAYCSTVPLGWGKALICGIY